MIFMDFHGFSWIFMDFHGFSCMDFHGFSWIFMDFHAFSWIFMDFHGIAWIFMLRREKPCNSLLKFYPFFTDAGMLYVCSRTGNITDDLAAEVQFIFMYFHGFSWIFMDFSWIFMDFHGFSWIFMDSHGLDNRPRRSRYSGRADADPPPL